LHQVNIIHFCIVHSSAELNELLLLRECRAIIKCDFELSNRLPKQSASAKKVASYHINFVHEHNIPCWVNFHKLYSYMKSWRENGDCICLPIFRQLVSSHMYGDNSVLIIVPTPCYMQPTGLTKLLLIGWVTPEYSADIKSWRRCINVSAGCCGKMAVPFSNTRLRPPQGFRNILCGLAREVLRSQPRDIYAFGTLYLEQLLKIRRGK
jgi:Regulatory subunit of type II PKA R-subunit